MIVTSKRKKKSGRRVCGREGRLGELFLWKVESVSRKTKEPRRKTSFGKTLHGARKTTLKTSRNVE